MKFQVLLKKQIYKIFLIKILVNKSEIRKKLLKARKLNNNKNLAIKFSNIIKILKKEKVNKKII